MLKRSHIRIVVVLVLVSLSVLLSILLGTPAGAHVCVDIHRWEDGTSHNVYNHCEPLMDEWAHFFPEADPTVDGDGVGFLITIPTPV